MMHVRVPAQLAPYIDVLGLDLGIEFLLKFGGSYVHLSENPQGRSEVTALIGHELTASLARRVGSGSIRVHTGKPFIAQHFRAKGWTTNAIARHLHVTDVTVRGWLKPPDDRQLSLL
ncbi:hypothetical protein ABIA22_000366 [Sinorhizobium fredii]|uniref:hypothetical protein n=1 Tax=Rhizobium fredii TaxID=380 RepID=UPI003512FE18